MPEVELPQLGESVTEGIIIDWLVDVGDEVEQDQPIVEISTDKVDTEIPSPVAGVVQELRADVDETIEVGQVIAVIGEGEPAESGAGEGDGDEDAGGEADQAEEAADGAAEARDTAEETAGDEGGEQAGEPAGESGPATADTREATEAADQPAGTPSTQARPRTGARPPAGGASGDGDAVLTSPIVRKMLREADIDPGRIEGTGQGGRITRADAEAAIEYGVEQPAAAQAGQVQQVGAQPAPPPAPAAAPEQGRPDPSPTQIDFDGQREITQDLSRVRRAIANAMHSSLQETAQLTAAVEVDVTGIMNLRAAKKDAFKQRHGVSLSPLPFMARAVCLTIPRHPAVNASIDMEEGTATFHRHINLGVAVDTDRGLLVPNLKDAQELTIPALATHISDLADRTRNKKISPDDIQDATFTITNTGSLGTLFDTPILNPPEVAILATCAIEKRPVVVSDQYGDSIAIRWMTYLCMTYDHRMIDGADSARFLQDLKWVLENHDFSAELGV